MRERGGRLGLLLVQGGLDLKLVGLDISLCWRQTVFLLDLREGNCRYGLQHLLLSMRVTVLSLTRICRRHR